ncbi:MAG TPA: hypothetical protein DIW47_10235 [Bacteroidetes bacterium]|nr:hypothetical protein [Bacteroidota bacterium]
MKRIKRFGVYQTAKVAAVIYFLIAAVFMLPFALIMSTVSGDKFPGFPFGGALFFILMPFLYGVLGFIMTAISCAIYNLVSRWTGGIEVEVETTDQVLGQ